MALTISGSQLSYAFTAGSTIILPNRLLASVATEQFVWNQLQSGLTTWQPPSILSIGAWLADCWQRARYAGIQVPTLLSPSQERAVWRDLIETEHPSLFDYAGAVSLAVNATRTLAEWHIPLDVEGWSASSDTRHFHHLHQRFRRRAKDQGWIVRADLWRLIPDWIGQPWQNKPHLTFAAFSSTTPALAAILKRLGTSAHLASIGPVAKRKAAPLYECADLGQELEVAARWARQQHQASRTASIAIFTPDLATHNQQLQRTLDQVFYSDRGVKAHAPESVFHIHATQPLLNEPLVASAILLLELGYPRIATANAGAILRSAFLSGAVSERNERALADANLRRHRDLDVSLQDIEKASSNCQGLRPVWSKIRLLLSAASTQLELPEWSEFIGNLLSAVGWPGENELTAAEQDVVEQWKSALTDLAALGLVCGKVLLPDAIAQLHSLLSARTIQVGDLASPIQVLDAADAYGLRFDYAAIVGLSEGAWPLAHQHSPFIPLQLQRPMLAGTAPQRAGATEALFSSAPSVLATFSGRSAPIIAPYVKRRKNDLDVWNGSLAGQALPAFSSEELMNDSKSPAFHLPDTSVPGGVSILKAQSQCPFQAFAKYRLSARRPEDACFGFDARERGSFLHRALENVWRSLQTRDQLRAMPTAGRRSLIHEAVQIAVGQPDDSPFHQLAGDAERARLEEVILEWLAIEESREQPFTVEHIEKDQSLKIAGLQVNLRIDRVDRLRDGSAVLIDYKSGEPKLKSLEGERPSEPQLLVYAAAMNEPIEGLFFAQLKPRSLRAVGWSRNKQFPVKRGGRKNTKPDWDDFLRQSNGNVQNIAAEFVSGWAEVSPQPGACTFCNLKPLCRINEQTGASDESDDAD